MITTHVLDTTRGRPAAGIAVTLDAFAQGAWRTLAHGVTDTDGRVAALLSPNAHHPSGRYRIVFATGAYFMGHDTAAFYPVVTVEFDVADTSQHYHVPLLISPFGYSTYRGS